MPDTAPVLPRPLGTVPPTSPDVDAAGSTPVDSPDDGLARLRTAFRLFQVQHARLLDHESEARGLHATDARLVFHLAAADGAALTPKQAGAFLGLSTGAMTSLVDRLERRGHLERRPNPADRRSILLQLTPSGAELAEAIGARWTDALASVVPAVDRAALADVFDRLGAALGSRPDR